jgi:type IV pilus assembly protein PilZ
MREPEKREHPRRSVEADMAFQAGEGPRIEARCRDLSLGGMFIETPDPLPYGAVVRVFLRLPSLRGEANIEAVVRWSKPGGMGVQFGRMGARETHGLTELMSAG